MKFKSGVDKRDLSAPAWVGLEAADRAHNKLVGFDVTCTSTGEGRHHVERSRHYNAGWRGHSHGFDVRTWHVDPKKFAKSIRRHLGADSPHYVVVVESTHIHVHWAPIYSGGDLV